MSLQPTYEPAKAEEWSRPGGPWDSGTLFDLTRIPAWQLGVSAADLAHRMHGAGIRPGQIVAWQLPNGSTAIHLFWACWRIGAVAAPLHRRLGAAEVASALGQVDPAIVIASSDLPASEVPGAVVVPSDLAGLGPSDSGATPEFDFLQAQFDALDGLLGVSGSENLPGGQLSSSDPEIEPLSELPGSPATPDDIALVLFTSGSSGVPKAVMHAHKGLAYKAKLMARIHGLERGAPVLAPAPLAHVSGLLNGVLISAAVEGPCVLLEPWDPAEGLRLLDEERIAFMGAPPIFFSQMADLPQFSRERVANLKLISTGGASVSPAFVDSTAEAYGCRVKRTYGSTEAPTVTTSGPDDPYERARDTDGRAVGEVEIEVRDPATGEALGPDVPGELWIRGPEMFAGYVDQAKTDSTVVQPGGWYRSGDLGTLDEEGWLRVTGRLSDTIIRAGENISASEVEAALEAHPAVRNAVAVPVPDARLGERVAAIVVLSGDFDLEECRRWFTEREVTRFKTPELVIAIDSIPTLAAGKPDRAALKAMAERISNGASGTPGAAQA
jgi:cyclohexanecarboxylate-CoA ligase